jgi:hypothetical protein
MLAQTACLCEYLGFPFMDTLPLREQLVTLHAMTIAIPTLQRCHPLKVRIAAIRGDLRPNEAELGDILKDATRHSARLKEELAG